jgi:hypothetical protein
MTQSTCTQFQYKRHWMAAVVTAVALGALVLSPVVVKAETNGQVTRTTGKGQEAAATVAYWTPERMAAAVPMDLGRPNTGAIQTQGDSRMASGTPGRAGGYDPVTRQVREPQGVHFARGSSPEAVGSGPQDGSYPGPNDTFLYVPPYKQFPISAVGKLYGHDPNTGGNFQCTASVTTGNASILNVIWTAGHCVANGGSSYFYDNFLFCPQLKKKAEPVGCWAWNGGAGVFTAWFASGDLTLDEGVLTLNHTGSKLATDVANVTGSLGFAWNWGRDQHWEHFGYPCVTVSGITPVWDCTHIAQTSAEHRYDVNIGGSGPNVNSWGSAQTEGSSGSAVQLFFSYGGGDINSNVSFYFTSGPNGNEHGIELQGPYYDSNVCSGLWQPFTGYTGTC